jgi:mono/diheme cytochrome c family protein
MRFCARKVRAMKILALALFLAACAGPEKPAVADIADEQAAQIEDGRYVARENCSTCHAIDVRGESPLAAAPPFREIGRRYSFPVLQEELIEGIGVGHPPMPRFQLSPLGVDALVAYLRHIQVRDRDGDK